MKFKTLLRNYKKFGYNPINVPSSQDEINNLIVYLYTTYKFQVADDYDNNKYIGYYQFNTGIGMSDKFYCSNYFNNSFDAKYDALVIIYNNNMNLNAQQIKRQDILNEILNIDNAVNRLINELFIGFTVSLQKNGNLLYSKDKEKLMYSTENPYRKNDKIIYVDDKIWFIIQIVFNFKQQHISEIIFYLINKHYKIKEYRIARGILKYELNKYKIPSCWCFCSDQN